MDRQERAEERADQARAYIDELAGLLGDNPQVEADVLTDCIPGQDDSGLDLIYTLRVQIEPGAAERLAGDIADRFTDTGWAVTHDQQNNDVVSVRFAKDTFTMAAKVSEVHESATVTGSGGCVR